MELARQVVSYLSLAYIGLYNHIHVYDIARSVLALPMFPRCFFFFVGTRLVERCSRHLTRCRPRVFMICVLCYIQNCFVCLLVTGVF